MLDSGILPVLNSGYLDHILINQLRRLNIKFKLQIEGWLTTQQINFRALQYPNFDWEATVINKDKMFLCMAAFYHYALDVTSLQQFWGWRARGEHRCQKVELLYWSFYVLPAQVFVQLWPGYLHGTLNKMHSINDKHTYRKFLKYRNHGNIKNPDRYP
jgi:hypothetical protein